MFPPLSLPSSDEVEALYAELCETIAEDFEKIYDQAVTIAAEFNIEPSKPRTSERQKNRTAASEI